MSLGKGAIASHNCIRDLKKKVDDLEKKFEDLLKLVQQNAS